MKIFEFSLLFMLISGVAWGLEPITSMECRGGDGPTPLISVDEKFPNAPVEIATEGRVQDFLLWQNREHLVYRNTENQLFTKDLRYGYSRRIGTLTEKMSRVVDYGERVLLVENKTRYFDTIHGHDWINYVTHLPISNHLYWHWDTVKGDVLYSLASVFITPNVQNIEIYSYTRKMTEATSCGLPSTPGQFYHVAKGHTFPYVYLYRTEETDEGSIVSFYRVRLESGLIFHSKCEFKKFGPSIKISGKVKTVQFYEGGKSVGIITDVPEKRVIWANMKACFSFDLGEREPLLLGDGSPLMATWDNERGVQVIFLDSREMASVMREGRSRQIVAEDLLLSEDENSLIMKIGAENQMYLKSLK